MLNVVELTRRWIELDTRSGADPARLAAIASGPDHVRITGPADEALDLARTIYALSARAASGVEWALWHDAVPESLIHSELFGHLAGAFGGGFRSYRGRVWNVDGGTLVIAAAQRFTPGLRRVLDRFATTGDVWPIGATSPAGRVDVRTIEISQSDAAVLRLAHRTAF